MEKLNKLKGQIMYYYPIVDLLTRTIKNTGLSFRELAEKVGYKNISKGMQTLREFLESGDYNRDHVKNYSKIFPMDPLNEEIALKATQRILYLEDKLTIEALKIEKFKKEISRRANFVAEIEKLTERDNPSPMIVFLMFGEKDKYVKTSRRMSENSLKQQIKTVTKFIKKDFAEMKGRTRFFGVILGYRYRYGFDCYIDFNTDGIEIKRGRGKRVYPKASISMGGRTLELNDGDD